MNLPKALDLWLPDYLRGRMQRLGSRPKRIWVTFADHYEPLGGNASLEQGRRRVAAWQNRWPEIVAAAPRDSVGDSPKYTFFYPQEEYQHAIVSALEPMTRAGMADVEVHLHHDRDTAAGFKSKLEDFTARLHGDHGFLRRHNGQLTFGFIHGNWALDNSRPDGRWCGVTGELQILRDLGCYADFTMPSIPSRTQSRIVNRIYWTAGNPTRPRGFDRGVEATIGGGRQGDLLMVPGPAGFRFRDRLLPRVESGELAGYDLPTPNRIQRWLNLAPRLGDDLFLKLHAHGAREDNAAALLGPKGLAPLLQWMAEAAAHRSLELRWATAWEMFTAIQQLIAPVGAKL